MFIVLCFSWEIWRFHASLVCLLLDRSGCEFFQEQHEAVTQHQNYSQKITAGSRGRRRGEEENCVCMCGVCVWGGVLSTLTCTLLSLYRASFTACYATWVYAMCYRLVKYLSSLLCKLRVAGSCQSVLPRSPSPLPSSIFPLIYCMCAHTGNPDVTTNLCYSASACV